MAKQGKQYIVARIKQLRAEGLSKRDAGALAYREAGQGKSRARGSGGAGKGAARGVSNTSISHV